ncbi:unnamed protein product [Clonostachys rosea f. rosea IK726]|uniref:Uncharacterized protein n=1 Tax=Clonostachys rosea f. rosea IK726 TaxID=1349383 RepID=A0ACA9TSF6_BIOOC|nr:unnamed protein product [Clonostachys rosea f. rosea IK726]
MAPTIHLIRHAQGVHNLSFENESIHDPDLTELGLSQCATVRETFPAHDKLTRLAASPMRRTLHTCIHSVGSERLYPVVALDVLQEVSASGCDIGSPVERLTAEFGSKVDTSRVRDVWTDKGESSPFEPTLAKLTARAREARRALRDLAGDMSGDAHVAAVSHGGFLHFLTDDWHGIPTGSATGWANCQFRSYQFVDPTGQDDEAELVETAESWRRRQGDQIPPTRTELREMRAVVQEDVIPYLYIKK